MALSRATFTYRHGVLAGLRADVFLDHLDGAAAILPRIVAIGDLDEDEIIFAEAATAELAEDALQSLIQSNRCSGGFC